MTALEQAQTLLAARALSWQAPEANRLDARIVPENLLPAFKILTDHRWGYLAAITGLDGSPTAAEMEALYHLCASAEVLTLRVALPRAHAALPSICALLPYASVFERELAEMFGVEIYGAPDSSRLFLPDDWPQGLYPLRKDAPLESALE